MKRICPLLLAASSLFAQLPTLSNGTLEHHSAARDFNAVFGGIQNGGDGPFWIGYAVPAIPGEHQICCDTGSGHGCGWGSNGIKTQNGKVQLEAPSTVFILFRLENRQLQKVKLYSPECEFDAGGLTLHWLDSVNPLDSLRFLESLGQAGTGNEHENSPRNSAVTAIAFHQHPETLNVLDRLAQNTQANLHPRKEAIFWLASLHGKHGYETVSHLAHTDSNEAIREHCIFALTLSKEPAAIPAIIDIAKTDRSTHIRGQALFWLSQRAGKQAVGAISDSVEHDPTTEVKKKAVFALSRLPNQEGVPILIQAARNNANPAVRKEAIFWLGQSQDPRALEFFESVLSK